MFNHTCKNCNQEFKSKKRLKNFCCDACFQEYRKRPEIKANTAAKRMETCIQRYGVDNPAKATEVKLKAEKTCLSRYGSKSPTMNKEIRQLQIHTCIEKYGETNPMKSDSVKNKMFSTCEQRYGHRYINQSDAIKIKKQKTCLKKYGVDNIAKLKDIKERTKETNLKRYGHTSPSQNENIKQKQIESKKQHVYKLVIEGNRLPSDVTALFSYDEYINSTRNNEYKFKCNSCESEFYDHLANGRIPRCLHCNPHKLNQATSRHEQEIFDFIKSIYTGRVVKNTYSVIPPLEIDIFLPEESLAIEVNGLYWHSQLAGNKYKNYHLNKTNSCNKKNIQLIHIFEDEWIFKKEIIKSKLKSIISENSDKIYGRNCYVKVIDSKTKNEFLNAHHIQGEDKSKIKLGLYNKESLVAVMTFSNNRMVMGKKSFTDEYELSRYATSAPVLGGAGKLLSYFIKNYKPKKITSYADRRFSRGNLYECIGFTRCGDTPPNYWYMDCKYNDRKYRFQFSKHMLKNKIPNYDPELSEWENMKLNGYDRIWDCGSIKFEMIIDRR